MKKLLIVACAVAMACAAEAEVWRWTAGKVTQYEKDSTTGGAGSDGYSFYYLTQTQARNLVNTGDAVTYAELATWLDNSFPDNKDAVKSTGMAIRYGIFHSETSAHQFEDMSSIPSSEYYMDGLAVAFYNNAGEEAYQTLGIVNIATDPGSYLYMADEFDNNTSGWQAVPEPTSGLLVLIGMVSLALKRKRA